MPLPPQPSPVLCPPSSGGFWRVGLPLALFAVLWVDLCRQLSYTWETNEQYAYGWFVPILALALFIRRWPSRPGGPEDHRTTGPLDQRPKVSSPVVSSPVVSSPVVSSPVVSGLVVSGLVVLLCLLLLPLRVIIEINPDWPLITWPYTLIVVALTLYAVHLAAPPFPLRLDRGEGQGEVSRCSSDPRSSAFGPPSSGLWSVVSSPWLLHFAFPICFILVAVQWPYRIEKGLTQNLMQIVASLTVEIIGWFGIPAIQRGNLIELSTGVLGVDEACSGIRSFQSTLMAALFLGELYRLRWPIRLLLVGAGLTAAFLLNVCRTLILTWQANAHGMSAIDKWHDPAGFTIAIACFAVLWALAVLINRKWPQEGQGRQDHGTTDNSPVVSSPVVCSPPSPEVSSPLSVDSSPPSPDPVVPLSRSPVVQPTRYLVAVGCWSLLCLAVTEIWYRAHEIKDVGVFHWSVPLPETKPGFEKIELPPRSLKLLAFDLGATGKWSDDEGSDWTLYFFRWNPRSVQSVIQSRLHRPEVCLPASGLRQISESKMDIFDAGNLKLPFRTYIYEAEGRTLYVFFCQWEDGAETQAGLASSKQTGRLQSVFTGRRLLGQQSLELILTGYDSLEKAEAAVRRRLPELIRPEHLDRQSPGKVGSGFLEVNGK